MDLKSMDDVYKTNAPFGCAYIKRTCQGNEINIHHIQIYSQHEIILFINLSLKYDTMNVEV